MGVVASFVPILLVACRFFEANRLNKKANLIITTFQLILHPKLLAMLNAPLRRGGEVLAATLVVAFVSLRCMELVDVYCQSRMHLVLHAGLAVLAALRPGLPRVTLLSVLYGVMRHRLDVQVYAAPEATSLAGAIIVIAGASSGRLCRKQGCMAGQRRPNRLIGRDWSKLRAA